MAYNIAPYGDESSIGVYLLQMLATPGWLALDIPTRNGYYLPSEDHEDIWPEIRELHFKAIRRAADRGGLRPKTKEGHSPGVLEYLRNTLGRSLPDPAYSG